MTTSMIHIVHHFVEYGSFPNSNQYYNIELAK